MKQPSRGPASAGPNATDGKATRDAPGAPIRDASGAPVLNTGGAHARDAAGAPARAALARYYDLDLQDAPDDVELYQALASRAEGPVLELAAGSGRIAVPLAAAGHDVVGVDNDPEMLARAELAWKHAADAGSPASRRAGSTRGRSKHIHSGSLRLVEADLTTVRLKERFGLAILALNTLLLLDQPERQRAAIQTLGAHLRRDGLAVVDVWLPGPDDLAMYDGRLLLEWMREDPDTGDRVTKIDSARYDAATATVILTQLFDVMPRTGQGMRRIARTDRLRLVGATELVGMFESAGMAVERLAGDHRMAPFGPGVERAIVVARLV